MPHRLDDGFAVTNVYEDRVVLPVSVEVVDPASAGRSRRSRSTSASAQEVCVPDHVEAPPDGPAGETDAAAAEILADARALVPGAPEPGVFAVESVVARRRHRQAPGVRHRGDRARRRQRPRSSSRGRPTGTPDAPELVGETSGKAAYDRRSSSRLGAKTPIAGARFRVTIVSGGRAIEQTIGLD